MRPAPGAEGGIGASWRDRDLRVDTDFGMTAVPGPARDPRIDTDFGMTAVSAPARDPRVDTDFGMSAIAVPEGEEGDGATAGPGADAPVVARTDAATPGPAPKTPPAGTWGQPLALEPVWGPIRAPARRPTGGTGRRPPPTTSAAPTRWPRP